MFTDLLSHPLPCPFCGKPVDLEDGDTLYPNGTGWEYHRQNGFRTYRNFRDVPKEQWCYSLHCTESAGGCGAEMSADSREEAIAKWNTRA